MSANKHNQKNQQVFSVSLRRTVTHVCSFKVIIAPHMLSLYFVWLMMALSYDVLLEYGVFPYDALLEYGACSYDVFLGYGVCFQVAV